MATSDDFPTNLTDEEQAAGFAITTIPNPKRHYFLEPKEIDAAVRALPDGRIAVKMAHPGGGVTYAIWDAKTHRPVAMAAPSFEALMVMYPFTKSAQPS